MSEMQAKKENSIRIGISSCLLGQEVRYDGAHKHSRYITETLGQYFEFMPFCPEVAIGMGIPRAPIRLVNTADRIRVRGVKDSSIDVTQQIEDYAMQVVPQVKGLSGYLFKRASPSCGMERVKVYTEAGMPVNTHSGIYAGSLLQALPELPAEEEGRLMDPVLRENFIERVFVYNRWQNLLDEGLTAGKLVDFHTRHKYSVLAHDEPKYRQLGQLVAEAGKGDLQKTATRYISLLMQALTKKATPKTHTNVLQHMSGYLKEYLDKVDKKELLEVIDSYRLGLVPLIVPITLLKHHFRKNPDDYILQQYYLNPHPKELMLRNSL